MAKSAQHRLFKRRRFLRRPRFEQLEVRQMLAANPLGLGDADTALVAEAEAPQNSWHNELLREDVDRNEQVTPIDALVVVNDLNTRGPRLLVAAEAEGPLDTFPLIDVNGDGFVTSNDVLLIVNALNAEAEGGSEVVIEEADVKVLLSRAAAATATEDAIIAIVDRGGRILGVRAEADVLTTYEGRTEEFVFAIDGAVAKARTAWYRR